MAIVKNDPFPGVDYNSYQDWEKVVLPSGEVLYTVPGNPAYVFDPVASNATGRKVFRRNPKEAIAEQQKQQEIQDKQIKQQQFNQSPLGQLLPAGASIAGLYAANKLASGGLPSLPSLPDLGLGGSSSSAPEVVSNVDSATQGFMSGGSGAADGAFQVGTNADGSILMSDGSTQFANGLGEYAQAPGTFGQVLGGAAAAKGAYDSYNAFQRNGEGIRSGATQLGSGIGTMVAGPLGTVGGALVGNAIGYGLQGKGLKNDLALLGASGGMAAPYVLARRLGFDGFHKTTRQRAQENTKALFDQAGDDKATQDYLHATRDQYGAAPPDPSKPFYNGKYGSFDEYQKAGLNADDLAGVYGNLSTYGAKEWAGLTNEQRRAVTQKNIDAGNYYSSKGEVEIKDKELAKKLKDEALGMRVPASNVDAATKAATQPKWIRRNGQIVKVA